MSGPGRVAKAGRRIEATLSDERTSSPSDKTNITSRPTSSSCDNSPGDSNSGSNSGSTAPSTPSTKPPAIHSTPSTKPPAIHSSPPRPDESTETYLSRLTAEIINFRNDRDWDSLLNADYLTHFTLRTDFDTEERKLLGLHSHILDAQYATKAYPTHYIRILSTKADVNSKGDAAIVFLNTEIYDMPPGVVQTGAGYFEWRKRDDKWTCVRSIGVRGTPSTDRMY